MRRTLRWTLGLVGIVAILCGAALFIWGMVESAKAAPPPVVERFPDGSRIEMRQIFFDGPAAGGVLLALAGVGLVIVARRRAGS